MKNLLRNISMMTMVAALAACGGGGDDDNGGSSGSGGGTTPTFPTPTFNEQDHNKPIGFGASITGSGDGGTMVTVSNQSALYAALEGTDAKTIYVKGTINFSGLLTIEGAKNKTIYGLPGATFINATGRDTKAATGVLHLYNCSNIIIRNIKFKSAGAYDIDAYDNLHLDYCRNIWIDHCYFLDGVDGNLDCTSGSNNICVSWCRFGYEIAPKSGGDTDDHRFSNLWGNGDGESSKDADKLCTTFANCWWDKGCKARMPRVRFGKVHILNCLFSSTESGTICVGAGYRSNIYLEKCAFTTSQTQKYPWKDYIDKTTSYTDYNITVTGCSGASDEQKKSGSYEYFTPTYSYDSYDASKVSSVVGNTTDGAGNTLTIHENEKFTTAYKR